MGEDLPADPFSAMAEGAVQMHETYEAFREAGFTDDQAFAIVLTCLSLAVTAQLQKGSGGPADN